MESIISLDIVKRLYAKDDTELMALDDSIEKQTSKILDADIKQEAFEAALTLEYMIVNQRALINKLLGQVRNLYATQSVPETVKVVAKAREQQLLARSSRLTDLREDVNAIQKLAYVVRGTLSI